MCIRDRSRLLSLNNRAMLAADKLRIMAKHCLMLYKSNTDVHGEPLKEVISLIKPGAQQPAVTAQTPTPSLSPLEDGQGQIFESPPEEETPWWEKPIPYKNGVIDWATLEDELPLPAEDETLLLRSSPTGCILAAPLEPPPLFPPLWTAVGVHHRFTPMWLPTMPPEPQSRPRRAPPEEGQRLVRSGWPESCEFFPSADTSP